MHISHVALVMNLLRANCISPLCSFLIKPIKIKLISPVLDQKMASSVDSMKKGELPTPGAQLNSAHNLEWTVALEPNSETELLVKWSVEHPNGETVEYVEQF